MNRTVAIILGVIAFLLCGLVAALIDGGIPETTGRWLIALFVVGPLILLAEPLLQLVCYAIGLPVRRALKHIPIVGNFFVKLSDEGISLLGLVSFAICGGVALWMHNMPQTG